MSAYPDGRNPLDLTMFPWYGFLYPLGLVPSQRPRRWELQIVGFKPLSLMDANHFRQSTVSDMHEMQISNLQFQRSKNMADYVCSVECHGCSHDLRYHATVDCLSWHRELWEL